MSDEDKGIHIEDDDARAAETTGVMRYVLGISLLLAIIAMTLVWIIPALHGSDVDDAPNVTERAEAMRDNGVAEDDIPGLPDSNPTKIPNSATPPEDS